MLIAQTRVRGCIFLMYFFKHFILFTYFWLHWVSAALCGLSLGAVRGATLQLYCTSFSLWRILLLISMGSRRAGSRVGVHRFCCLETCIILQDQGSNLCLLYWQVDA